MRPGLRGTVVPGTHGGVTGQCGLCPPLCLCRVPRACGHPGNRSNSPERGPPGPGHTPGPTGTPRLVSRALPTWAHRHPHLGSQAPHRLGPPTQTQHQTLAQIPKYPHMSTPVGVCRLNTGVRGGDACMGARGAVFPPTAGTGTEVPSALLGPALRVQALVVPAAGRSQQPPDHPRLFPPHRGRGPPAPTAGLEWEARLLPRDASPV